MARKKHSRRTLPILFLNGSYYTRIRWGFPEMEVFFPLATTDELVAEDRRDKIADTSLKNKIKSAYEKHGSKGVKQIKKELDWYKKGGWIVSTDLTFEQALEQYKEYLAGQRLAKSTQDLYIRDLKKFAELTSVKYVSRIQNRTFSSFKNKLTHLSANTINRHLRVLQTFFNWMYDETLIDTPIRIKKLPIVATPARIYSNDEFQVILNNVEKGFPYKQATMDADDIQLFLDSYRMYRDTGLRLAEPFDNELKVDSDGFRLRIIGSTTKNKYQRFVHLTEYQATTIVRMNEWVDAQVKRGRKHRYYCIQVFSRVFKKSLEKSGIDGKFHNLRKTFASRLWFLTGQEFALCYALGHTDTSMTKQYTSLDKVELARSFPDLERLRNLKDSPENTKTGDKKREIELYSNFGFMYIDR
jgi:integrase